ncbi:MAG TPA: hypothetical protein GX505_02965 [Clostridiales bacterium]|nr:hypothetical protein [Clostridiales bacterium]
MNKNYPYNIKIALTTFDGCHPVKKYTSGIMPNIEESCHMFEGSKWYIKAASVPVENNLDAADIKVSFRLAEGNLNSGNVSVILTFDDWSTDNYCLIPAAAYNGNRFRSIKTTYPPMLTREDGIGVKMETTITDVPRLNIGAGTSRIQLLSGDTATPAAGFYMPGKKKGFFMITYHSTPLGYSGITLEENEERTQACLMISAPGVRYDTKYVNNDNSAPGDDVPYNFSAGYEITISLRAYFFDCPDIPALFDYFFHIRKDLNENIGFKNIIPFSGAMRNIEEKHNSLHWDEEYGIYKITSVDMKNGYWQAGWVGGGINTYPLLMDGNQISKERAFQTIDTIISKYQVPTGFFYATVYKNQPFGDNFRERDNTGWSLIRKQADLIYFLVKQCILIEKLDGMQPVPVHWKESIKKAADALVRVWKKYKQFGQFIDIHKEEILIGGTASGAMAPAALALASMYFNCREYLKTAEEAANYYYYEYLAKGLVNGGPGEIAQCPDSESAFALLESYVVLYEVTKDRKWLAMAEDAAKHFASWCVSYSFDFPKSSEFGRLGINTVGSVYANVQNKHSAPGICTLSGVSLFKLYRATRNPLYLELIRDIAHNITQYLSTRERPIRDYTGKDRPPGYMCERVNMSDWEGKGMIGMVFLTTWPEVSCMLTYSDVPGVYIQKDTGYICVIDHIEAEVLEKTDDHLKIRFYNNTAFDANVKLFIETSRDMDEILGEPPLQKCTILDLPSNSYKELII